MAAKIRFLDNFKCLYNKYIFELLMHTHFDQLGLKMTYKVFFLYKCACKTLSIENPTSDTLSALNNLTKSSRHLKIILCAVL